MTTIRIAPATLLAAMVLATLPAPVALADRVDPADGRGISPCRVRNVTQDTRDRSFRRMVAAAKRGDVLHVRGTCTGGVTIRKSLVIEGVGRGATLSGRGRFRVLDIGAWSRAPHVHLLGIRIIRGRAGDGGGIRVGNGRLTMTDSILAGNRARDGGGILVYGSATLRRTVVRGNTATDSGGGMLFAGKAVTLIDSVVRDNRATGGGGIADWGSGTLTLIGSSVRRNVAETHGGGISSSGTLSIRRSSVAGNTAGTDGGGIWTFPDSYELVQVVHMLGSAVSSNTAGHYGGGIYIVADADFSQGTVVSLAETTVGGNRAGLDAGGIFAEPDANLVLASASAVSGNDPNDCVGTPAC